MENENVYLLNIPKVVMELLVGDDDPLASQIESRILEIDVYTPIERIKCFEVGLKDYVRKNHTCFLFRENLKVANSSGRSQGNSILRYLAVLSPLVFASRPSHHALASLATKITWILHLLQHFGISLDSPHVLYSDNISALHLTSNLILHAH